MKRTLTESGEWRDGAARPTLLPDQLRRLPGELIAKDVDDPDRAHEIDAPHVVNSIVSDFIKAQEPEKDDTPQKVVKKLHAPGPGERAPVRQWFVDVAKMRVIAALIARKVDEFERGLNPDLSPCHLWFPNDNVNEYALRMGNPPSRGDRPKHLKDIDLVVDILNPPRSIMAELEKRGVRLSLFEAIKHAQEGSSLVHLV